MKKTSKLTMAVVSIMVIAVAALFSSCEGAKSSDNGCSISTRWQGYRVIDGELFAINNNGDPTELPRELAQQLALKAERIYREEGTTPLTANSLNPHILPSTTGSTSTSFPYNYGINNEVTANLVLNWNGVLLRPLDTFFVKGYHQVDNTANGPFMEQSHTVYTMCRADETTVILYGDSVSCRQNFSIREVLPTVIHDTVWRERVVHDTIHHTDTIWRERVIHDTVVDGRWVDSVVTRRHAVVSHHHISTTTTDTYTASTATYQVRCYNRTDSAFTEKLYLFYNDQSVDSSRVRNWIHSVNWQKIWSRSVTLNGSNPGSGRVNISGGTASFGGGNSVVFGTAIVTTNPTGYASATTCNDVLVYATAVSGGVNIITVVRHDGNADSTQGFISWNGTTPPTPPTIHHYDTLWLNCTTATAWYQAVPAEQVKATVGKTYRLVRTWSDSHRDTIAGGTATATYTWNVVRTGQPTSAMASTLPVNGNPASFGGGSFTEELVQVGSQRFCPLNWNSATLTSSTSTSGTTTWSGSYGTTTVTVTVPETFLPPAPPITGKRLIAGWVTYAYQSNTSAPEEWGVLYTEDLATGQRYFEYIPWHTGTVTYSEVTNTTAIASSDTNAVRSQINAGRYGARVYNHNSTSHQWLPGMTHATQNGSSSSTSWTVTFWFCSGTEANHVDLIVGTTDVNSGNSRRGIWNGSQLSADGGTLYVSNL